MSTQQQATVSAGRFARNEAALLVFAGTKEPTHVQRAAQTYCRAGARGAARAPRGGRTLLSAVLEETHAYAKPSCAAGATGLSVMTLSRLTSTTGHQTALLAKPGSSCWACMRGPQAGVAGSRRAAGPRAARLERREEDGQLVPAAGEAARLKDACGAQTGAA